MKIILFIIAIGILCGAVFFYKNSLSTSSTTTKQSPVKEGSSAAGAENTEVVTVIAENLDTPWAIAFLPDDAGIFVTERSGRVRLIDASGNLQETPAATLSAVREISEGGLLGITLHPDFAENTFVYLYYTYSAAGNNTMNRVVRMTYADNRLTNEEIILDRIPGAPNHDGGRIKFGPDKFLYIGTGDAQEPSQAQDTGSLAGKILRVTDHGKPVPENPFKNAVYSYGHRNVQGLAWDADGVLWATEHGRSGVTSGLDELNRIQAGKNYGWPEIEGTETRSGMESPKRNSGATTTWAPSGADFVGDSFFFSGLRGRTLYEAVMQNGNVTEVKEHFSGEFGRIREVLTGPDGMLYITTSNTDGRGVPGATDDRLIRIDPARL
jgi:glucose/arabinose dehydrogenase